MSTKLVSVITPLYNSEAYIQACINSVISQSYNNWEMIIIDDGSTDNSFKMAESVIDKRIRLIKLPVNMGASYARNTAIKLAKGKYIAFLDADDLWNTEKLKLQIKFMEENNIPFSYTSYGFTNENDEILPKIQIALPSVNYDKMLKNNYIGCLTAVYNCSELGKMYMPEFRKRHDWGLWLQLLKKTNIAKSINQPLAYYRVGHDSLSKNKIKLLKTNFKFYNKYLGYSSFKSFYKMMIFLYSYFLYKKKYTIESK
jgi:glycosyltransferase involved in cell wall biosynthesis